LKISGISSFLICKSRDFSSVTLALSSAGALDSCGVSDISTNDDRNSTKKGASKIKTTKKFKKDKIKVAKIKSQSAERTLPRV